MIFPNPLSWLRTAGIVALAVGITAVVVGAWAYQKGWSDQRTATLTRSVEVLRERNATDDRFQSLSDDDLCISLGGMPDDATGECL